MNQLMSNRDAMAPDLSPAMDDAYVGGDEQSALSIFEQAWTAVITHRNLAIGVILGVLLLGLVATFLATPQYRSTTRLEILPDAPVATSVEGQRDKALVNEISFYNTQ